MPDIVLRTLPAYKASKEIREQVQPDVITERENWIVNVGKRPVEPTPTYKIFQNRSNSHWKVKKDQRVLPPYINLNDFPYSDSPESNN